MELSTDRPRYVGVIHLPPLPGTPYWDPADWPACIARVRQAAVLLAGEGMDGVLLQSADRVYPTGDEAEAGRVVAMTRYADAVAGLRGKGFVAGAQLLRHGVTASLAVARLTGLDFVRVGALIGATLTTHGWVEPDSLTIMRRRRELDANGIAMICDIDSSHFQWAGGALAVADLAHKALLVGADAVAVDYPEVERLQSSVAEIHARIPAAAVFQGGHLSAGSVRERSPGTVGGFVRGCLLDGDGEFDRQRVAAFVKSARG